MRIVMSHDDGFSLLELLVAIAILSLAVIPMLSNQAFALRSATDIQEKALAQIVAENTLVTFTARQFPPQTGTVSGTQTQGTIPFDWTAGITAVPGQKMLMITVTVSGRDNRDILARLTGFRKSSA